MASTAASDEEAGRNIRQHRVAQFGVGMRGEAVDGDIRETTRAAVRAFQTANGLEPTGVVDNALYAKLVKIVEDQWANARPLLGCDLEETLNVFECTLLNKSMVSDIQEHLGVPKTGVLDPETRTAIAGFHDNPPDRPEKREVLSFGLTKAILGLS